LTLQRAAAQERHRLERELAAVGEVFDQAARVAARALLGERDDRIVDGRHPRVEFFFQSAREKSDVGATDGHERSVHREPFVAALLHHLFESGRDRHHRLTGARPTVEGDHRDRRVEQQLECEALLFIARAQAPRLRGVGVEQPQRVFLHAGECRLRAVAQHGEVVVVETLGAGHVGERGCTGGI